MTHYQKHDVSLIDHGDYLVMRANTPLEDVANTTGDWLHQWAAATPDATFIAERSGEGWRKVSYGEAQQKVRAIGAALIARGMNASTPILVISGNSVDHGLLALGAQYVGVPIVPLAEQYALIPEARGRMMHAASVVKPKLVFADDGARYKDALDGFEGVEIVTSTGNIGTSFSALIAIGTDGVDEAHGHVTPETVAKILMTSGSTSLPKAVPTTHKMLCTNQAQLAQAMPFLIEKRPVIVDWLPWNHVFGGSHNFNMMLANGGTYYIDDGKPTEKLFGRTLENLNLVTGTAAFNVPVGFAMLQKALAEDAALAARFFENLDLIFYAGASLPQDVWEGLETLAETYRGGIPLMTSSWGLTETAPACIMQQEPIRQSGVIGVPLGDVDVKLLPTGEGRYEARVRGPNIFTGYLDAPEKTAEAFDDEGYFITGDAMAFVDESDPNKGLRFDGRISEEFKLLTGTWVRAGALRLELLKDLAPLVLDIVITGADKNDIGLMIFPAEKSLAAFGRDVNTREGVVVDAAFIAQFEERLVARAKAGQSSSTHIARALILAEPPSVSEGEMTAKGNLNFRKILDLRQDAFARLYAGGEGVMEIGK